MHKTEGAHLQCVNNPYAKFEYTGMKTDGVTRLHKQDTPTHFGWKNVINSTLLKK